MPKIIKSPHAKSDLLDIWDYIADDSTTSADNFLNTIGHKIQTLARSPKMGRTREELAPNLRSFPVGNYIIFYRPIKNGVEIARVLSGARDLNAIF